MVTATIENIPTESTATTLVPARSEALEAMAAVKFRIPGDTVATACKDLPDEQRTAIKWFAGYCRNRNLGQDEIATLLRKDGGGFYSWASIYAVLTGRRQEQGASVEPVVKAIETFRRQVEAGSRVGDSGFIRTRLSQAIAERCDRARARRKVGFIFGEGQIGKSESLLQYTREHNHGETIYVEAPTGGSLTHFVGELRQVLAIPQTNRRDDLHQRIIECFDEKMLLIVDEAHRFLHSSRGQHAFSFIRELYNKAGCGVMIAMTDEGREEFFKGTFAKRLEQLWRRRLAPLQLPNTVPVDDLALFAGAYELDPAPAAEVTVRTKYHDEHGREKERDYTESPLALQTRVVETEGLGVWLTILQDAKDMAKTQKRSISWAAVLKAYCVSQADAEVWG